MGASESLNQKAMHYGVQQFNSENWNKSESILKKTSSTAKLHIVPEECKPIGTYSSSKYTFLVDEYLLDSTEFTDVDEYLKEIEWRNRCKHLVNVKYLKGFSTSLICETSAKKNYLYIEHIPLRLSQITDIPFPDNLYLLKACLRGFYYIFLHTTNLDIREDQICLNEEGKIKVWMNANLCKNTPQIHNIFKASKKSELMLVNDIINIIDNNTDHQYEPKIFKEYLEQLNICNLNFLQAMQAVQNFAMLLHIKIPISLESVNDLLNPLRNSQINALNEFNITNYNEHISGRYVDTNETRMIESGPITSHTRPEIYFNKHRSSNQIKAIDTYTCARDNYDQKLYQISPQIIYNDRTINQDRRPMKVNIAFRNPEHVQQISYLQPSLSSETQTNRIINHSMPTHQNQIVNSTLINANDEEWRYFDANGWEEIDPQILMDLKKQVHILDIHSY